VIQASGRGLYHHAEDHRHYAFFRDFSRQRGSGGLDRHLKSPRHHREERLTRAVPGTTYCCRGIDRSSLKGVGTTRCCS
jgi:hypothetical protein